MKKYRIDSLVNSFSIIIEADEYYFTNGNSIIFKLNSYTVMILSSINSVITVIN